MMGGWRARGRVAWVALWLACGAGQAHGEGRVFGLAGKRVDDVNFVAAWRGCDAEARAQGDRCLHLGRAGSANARLQDEAIRMALQEGLAALAVSVMHSGFLADHGLAQARSAGIPVVTFDSDLDWPHRDLRRLYIGPDNHAFGRELGEMVRRQWPAGGSVCLMSADVHDPNLNQRLAGVRAVLSGLLDRPPARLNGEGGWTEPARCPWYNGDDPSRARQQIALSLESLRVQAVVSVGAWPIAEPTAYQQMLEGLRQRGLDVRRAVFVGTGVLSPQQSLLLRQGHLAGVVEMDFEAMGRAAFRAMKRLSRGERLEGVVRTGFKSRLAGAEGGP